MKKHPREQKEYPYLFESPDELVRLEIKTDLEAVRKEAIWCEVKPGMRVLDVGCGTGKTSCLLHELVQPGGTVLGIDCSEERVKFAETKYGREGLQFQIVDITTPETDLGNFDLVWVRLLLEHYRQESFQIVKTLTSCLKNGGCLCLMDLDHNCLSHYEMSKPLNKYLLSIMNVLEERYDFDPYAGRKLYAHLYDLGYEDICVEMVPYHLIYGKAKQSDIFNWTKKIETVSERIRETCRNYPGGYEAFRLDFKSFLEDPRRFTYTPLILCKGRKSRLL